MPNEELVRAKYVGRDFWTYFDDVKKRIQTVYGDDYNDFAESAIGVMLMDLVAYACDTLSFYLDRQATDCFLDTVQTRTAAERLARQIGYKMYGAVSASVDLSVTLNQSWGFAVTIPDRFKFRGPNSLVFEAIPPIVTFAAGELGPKTVPVREGETKRQTFISTGEKLQVVRLTGVGTGKFASKESVLVWVDGTQWTEVDFLSFEQTNQYEVGYGASPPVVRFGDGIVGNIPPAGSEIVIEYVVSSGKAGFAGSGSITAPRTPLFVSGNEILMTVTNQLAAGGQSDGESVQHTKTYAPRYFKSRDVAVTREDIEALSNAYSDAQHGAVAKAQAYSARSADEDLVLNTYLATIRELARDPVPAVTEGVADINTYADEAQAYLVTLGNKVVQIEGLSDTIDTAAETSYDDLQIAKNELDKVVVDGQDIKDQVTAGKAAIDAITAGGSDQLTSGTKTALKNYLSLIDTEASNVLGSNSTAKSKVNTVLSAQSDIRESTTQISDLITDIVNGEAIQIAARLVGIKQEAATILSVVVDTSDDTDEACQGVFDHVDAILSQECKANLVVVPILVADADGFYTGPSTALIKSLQEYLDARKEATTSIQVISGAYALVLPDVEVDVGVTLGTVKPRVESQIKVIVENLLKDRTFGASLYRSAIYNPVSDLGGVQYVNVRITAPTDKLDANGNLIIEAWEVISKGSLAVNLYDAE